MKTIHRWAICCIASFSIVGGCDKSAAPVKVVSKTDTGAESVAKKFYEALMTKDWKAAYSTLTAESKSKLSEEKFTELAQGYYKSLGFAPDLVSVGCEEHGGEAMARANFTGVVGTSPKSFRDGLTLLKPVASGWEIVLPDNFGVSPAKRK